MYISPQQLFSNGSRENRCKKFIQSPLIRMMIALISLIPAILIFNLIYKNLHPRWTNFIGDAGAVIVVILYYLCYSIYLKYIENRPNFELSLKRFIPESGFGFFVGAMLVIFTTILILYKGSFQIVSKNPGDFLIHAFFIFGLLAFVEELIFRCIVFLLLEEQLGNWISIVIIATIFGLVHLVHENATLISTIAIALQDLILTGSFILTRRIWLCWGIHWGWNYTQDGILGMPNSGVEQLPSWLITEISGPAWITGGSIGIESSVLGVLLNVIVGIVMIKIAINHGQVLDPIWQRRIRDNANL